MQLRPHQREALVAIAAAARDGHRRMSVVAASGTGKALIAQKAARTLAMRGTTVVVTPSKALVTQTVRRWRQAGHPGLMLGVCSQSQADSGLHPQQATMTSDPAFIAAALQATTGPRTVVATYGSLHHLIDAQDHGLPKWDLAVIDEAHRTCSAFGEGWGTVHDDSALPATTRLYLTATPRVWEAPAADLLGFMDHAPLATMDHQDVFGPTVYQLGLADAIARGILADYQVVLPVVEEDDLRGILNDPRPGVSPHHNGLRNAAVQVAVLRAVHDEHLRKVLVFHNRVEFATGFAKSLPETAAKIDEPLRHEAVWSRAVHSDQASATTQAHLDAFADPILDLAVLSNVRVLNEGVDIPAIDAIAFAAPRYSTIDAVQSVGRGLRQNPGAGKKTTLVIPVYLPGDSDGDLLANPNFANLITILQALRAHDESFMDRIALPHASTRTNNVISRELLYSHPERAIEIARILGLKIVLPALGVFDDALRSATEYQTAFGHLNVPLDHLDETGFPLGEWIVQQRLLRLLDRLPERHKTALNSLGMPWATPSHTDFLLSLAQAFARTHGSLAMRNDTVVGGHALGKWLTSCRTRAAKGTLPDELHSALGDIDPWWNPPWPQDWQREYARAKAAARPRALWQLKTFGEPTREQHDTSWWVGTQAYNFFFLSEEQQDLLLQIGVCPDTSTLFSRYLDKVEREFRYRLDLAAQYLTRYGHLRIPPEHQVKAKRDAHDDEPRSIPLGQWFQQIQQDLPTLPGAHRSAVGALLTLARRAADNQLGPQAAPVPNPLGWAAGRSAAPLDEPPDITAHPQVLSVAYKKAKKSKTTFVCIAHRQDGWSARIDTSTTKLRVMRAHTVLFLQEKIENAVRSGAAAWGTLGPVHFGIGGLPDEATARQWAARLHSHAHEELSDLLRYYGFVETTRSDRETDAHRGRH